MFEMWIQEYVGMSLRGFVQTFPAGFVLLTLGYGYDFMFSGGVLGLLYELAWHISLGVDGFKSGYQMGEFLHGFWTFLCLLVKKKKRRRKFRSSTT